MNQNLGPKGNVGGCSDDSDDSDGCDRVWDVCMGVWVYGSWYSQLMILAHAPLCRGDSGCLKAPSVILSLPLSHASPSCEREREGLRE